MSWANFLFRTSHFWIWISPVYKINSFNFLLIIFLLHLNAKNTIRKSNQTNQPLYSPNFIHRNQFNAYKTAYNLPSKRISRYLNLYLNLAYTNVHISISPEITWEYRFPPLSPRDYLRFGFTFCPKRVLHIPVTFFVVAWGIFHIQVTFLSPNVECTFCALPFCAPRQIKSGGPTWQTSSGKLSKKLIPNSNRDGQVFWSVQRWDIFRWCFYDVSWSWRVGVQSFFALFVRDF